MTDTAMTIGQLPVEGWDAINGKPSVSSTPYSYDIAAGNVAGHVPFVKIGYLPSMTANANTDIWGYGGTQATYLFPTATMGMEVLSDDNTEDISTVIHSGTSTGGGLTSLISAGENFQTTTALGDVVILDKAGAIPEYGYVSAIVSDTELTISGGFSAGGSGSGRAYSILDVSAKTGAQAVQVNYLDGSYAEKSEIILLNGTTVVPTVNLNIFRVNGFRVIAAGTLLVPLGNITIRHLSDTPVYSFITAGFNRARNIMYTVPADKTLYVTDFSSGYATTGNANKEYARITTRANVDPTTKFRTGNLFYPFTESLAQNTTIPIPLSIPTKLLEKTDIKVSCFASATGVIVVSLRGWLE
jgi:hypothetical protein